MSKISLKPNSAGTANFEIAAPATNTDRTFTLPDEAGTVLTNASDITSSQLSGDAVPIGVNQTWQNVTSSRSNGVTYTNTTGRPIYVSVRAGFSNRFSNNYGRIYVDGQEVDAYSLEDGQKSAPSAQAIVPAGSTYRASFSVGFEGFYELR